MLKKINSALISVYYKDGLEDIVRTLHNNNVKIISTGGTRQFIEALGIACTPAEDLTGYPSILGGRVKTLHPVLFGGILGDRRNDVHIEEMKAHSIPEIDMVMVDLYPFEETVQSTNDEAAIIEKIDIGGPSMLRAAAKNHHNVFVVSGRNDYGEVLELLKQQSASTTIEQRRTFAIKAFDICTRYDLAISNYFHQQTVPGLYGHPAMPLRYGENPHQQAVFAGDLEETIEQIHGKPLSYNNLVDVDAAMQLMQEFVTNEKTVMAIIKHTNVCGIAQREGVNEAWQAALQGDPESAFGGVIICNREIDKAAAGAINELFFEVLIAPSFHPDALNILTGKKNRVLLISKTYVKTKQVRNVLNGLLVQDSDEGNYAEWNLVSGKTPDDSVTENLRFANLIAKHLKSNAIALVNNLQLIGKGCGQTSRVDALRHAIAKAKHNNLPVEGSALGSDAFFPFDDCVRIAHEAGVTAFIQPGGSIRDKDSIEYCKANNLLMVFTGTRHFKH